MRLSVWNLDYSGLEIFQLLFAQIILNHGHYKNIAAVRLSGFGLSFNHILSINFIWNLHLKSSNVLMSKQPASI
jgi:hypothetical protein